jgi:hypothetical protein
MLLKELAMIPCCFHPTRVVIVNNSQELMYVLDKKLPRSNMTFDYFENMENALHYINEVYEPDPFYDRYKSKGNQAPTRKLPSNNLVIDTYLEIYRPQRFDEISTIVVNCSDSLISTSNDSLEESARTPGFDFFLRVKSNHIQKIMLVEEGRETIAVQALNSGLVQYVIYKTDNDWEERLFEALQDAQWQYFNKLSEIFMQSIRPGVVKEYAINDPQFQKLFKAIIVNHGFTEAYLYESTGSYLFLDGQAQDHGLVVNFADQLEQWVKTGKDKGIKLPLLKALKDRKKMMCYQTSLNESEPDKNHWEIYAYPANTMHGRDKTYYYAFAPNMYDIDVERVLPFEEYREFQQRKTSRLH